MGLSCANTGLCLVLLTCQAKNMETENFALRLVTAEICTSPGRTNVTVTVVPINHLIKKSDKYQPSGEGGTCIPPATPHCLQNPKWPPGAPKMA